MKGIFEGFWWRPQVVVLAVAVALAGFGAIAFHPQQVAIADDSSQQILPAKTAKPARTDCAKERCLALTFDDGPDPAVTPRVLDSLKKHQARATFFVEGRRVPKNEALIRRIHAEGHEIGNHSWDHPHFTRISPEQMQEQIVKTQEAVIKAGAPAPQLFRPPYGDTNQAVINQVPLAVVRWNIDPEDWNPRLRGAVLEHFQTYAKPGGIVVLHDTEATTADALDGILDQLQAQGFTLVTVSETLNIAPGQRGPFFGR